MRGVVSYVVLPVALALGACSSFEGKEQAVDPNLFPNGYRQEMLVTFTKTVADPTNIRSAAISDPVLRPVGQDQRYAVCMRADTRDFNEQYMGVKERIAWFWGGHLNQLVEAKPGECNGMVYKPWPELEKYCLAKNCT